MEWSLLFIVATLAFHFSTMNNTLAIHTYTQDEEKERNDDGKIECE